MRESYGKKIALWTVTKGAGISGKSISEKIMCDIFILEKFHSDFSENLEFKKMENFTETLRDNFHRYDAHIFIMATGIVIRKIADLLKGKDIDPAVVVVDENLNFVISLLSGHLGGANELALKLSEKFQMTPIITTSSDITGKIALDTLSERLNCQMESLEKAKKLTSLLVDGQIVELMIPDNLQIIREEKNGLEKKSPRGVVIASNREEIEIMRIYPKNLILGIGCRRGTAKEQIVSAILEAMEKNNLSLKSIKSFATVDLKADELGLLEAVAELDKPLKIISRDEIREIEDMFGGSDFVKSSIGVRAVSEPCAFLASEKIGTFIEQKYIKDGVTVSIYEESFGNEKK